MAAHADSEQEAAVVQAAESQSLFREVNERIGDLNRSLDGLMPSTIEWLCECADETCFERIEMSVADYEAIRKHPARFPVIPGHLLPELERVVETHESYVVVEKVGLAGEVAALNDPRGQTEAE